MNYREEAIRFSCEGDTLLGILSRPQAPARTGVLVIVGGPQYRVGSHRLFVLLSRKLANAGIAVLRFDYRGMGDSEGETRDFKTVNADIAAAIDEIYQQVPSIHKLVLWGLCDGASAALLYCFKSNDRRLDGLCLLNPWVRSDISLARTHLKHYYAQRLLQKEFWLKFLTGKMALTALLGLARNIQLSTAGAGLLMAAEVPFQTKMALSWSRFTGSIMLILSEKDFTAKEFLEYVNTNADWQLALSHPYLVRLDLRDADHSFSSAVSSEVIANHTLDWLGAQVNRSHA